ncbi:MAG: hypothetical protein HQK83_04680 [Fibrobacteria bacterium]|nr:hypothetical protein [Fibrobacteria bacterium]
MITFDQFSADRNEQELITPYRQPQGTTRKLGIPDKPKVYSGLLSDKLGSYDKGVLPPSKVQTARDLGLKFAMYASVLAYDFSTKQVVVIYMRKGVKPTEDQGDVILTAISNVHSKMTGDKRVITLTRIRGDKMANTYIAKPAVLSSDDETGFVKLEKVETDLKGQNPLEIACPEVELD